MGPQQHQHMEHAADPAVLERRLDRGRKFRDDNNNNNKLCNAKEGRSQREVSVISQLIQDDGKNRQKCRRKSRHNRKSRHHHQQPEFPPDPMKFVSLDELRNRKRLEREQLTTSTSRQSSTYEIYDFSKKSQQNATAKKTKVYAAQLLETNSPHKVSPKSLSPVSDFTTGEDAACRLVRRPVPSAVCSPRSVTERVIQAHQKQSDSRLLDNAPTVITAEYNNKSLSEKQSEITSQELVSQHSANVFTSHPTHVVTQHPTNVVTQRSTSKVGVRELKVLLDKVVPQYRKTADSQLPINVVSQHSHNVQLPANVVSQHQAQQFAMRHRATTTPRWVSADTGSTGKPVLAVPDTIDALAGEYASDVRYDTGLDVREAKLIPFSPRSQRISIEQHNRSRTYSGPPDDIISEQCVMDFSSVPPSVLGRTYDTTSSIGSNQNQSQSYGTTYQSMAGSISSKLKTNSGFNSLSSSRRNASPIYSYNSLTSSVAQSDRRMHACKTVREVGSDDGAVTSFQTLGTDEHLLLQPSQLVQVPNQLNSGFNYDDTPVSDIGDFGNGGISKTRRTEISSTAGTRKNVSTITSISADTSRALPERNAALLALLQLARESLLPQNEPVQDMPRTRKKTFKVPPVMSSVKVSNKTPVTEEKKNSTPQQLDSISSDNGRVSSVYSFCVPNSDAIESSSNSVSKLGVSPAMSAPPDQKKIDISPLAKLAWESQAQKESKAAKGPAAVAAIANPEKQKFALVRSGTAEFRLLRLVNRQNLQINDLEDLLRRTRKKFAAQVATVTERARAAMDRLGRIKTKAAVKAQEQARLRVTMQSTIDQLTKALNKARSEIEVLRRSNLQTSSPTDTTDKRPKAANLSKDCSTSPSHHKQSLSGENVTTNTRNPPLQTCVSPPSVYSFSSFSPHMMNGPLPYSSLTSFFQSSASLDSKPICESVGLHPRPGRFCDADNAKLYTPTPRTLSFESQESRVGDTQKTNGIYNKPLAINGMIPSSNPMLLSG